MVTMLQDFVEFNFYAGAVRDYLRFYLSLQVNSSEYHISIQLAVA